MTTTELADAISKLNDGGSALIIADNVVEAKDGELEHAFLLKVLEKCADGHHQTRQFALAGQKVLNG